MAPKVLIGIPARMASTRFPGKPLADILGMSMLEHVFRRCSFAQNIDQVFVATCDEEIADSVASWGGHAVMTDPDIARPALRVSVACEDLCDDDDIVVVVQGDEPLIHPEMIRLAVQPLLEDDTIFCVNLMGPVTEEQWRDPNEIKIVADRHGNALYMSRCAIPSCIHPERSNDLPIGTVARRQVCVFPFRKKNLIAFNQLPPSSLEEAESIEMLRAIEHGLTVRLVYSPFQTQSVDTEEDLQVVTERMVSDPLFADYANASRMKA